ncbi:MAG: NAD-dependent succinate-semialdehyde dehydrogenase [Rhodospirillales bacterium]
MNQDYGLFIGGEWRSAASGAVFEVLSPVTEKPVRAAPAASKADTESAVRAAEQGFAAMRALSGMERADKLHAAADEITRRKDEIVHAISTETGKPLAQSEREWSLGYDQFRWHAEEARRIYGRMVESRVPGGRCEVSRQPVGVVGAFTAWNFPFILATRKIAPALAAGCSVILRPAEEAPGPVMVLFDCLRAAALPAGAVNLVTGLVEDTYGPIMAAKSVRKISLTGSTRVGRLMMKDAADTVKKVSMELGGNAPIIVHDDVDLESVLDTVVPAKYANAGQVCVAPDRFFVHEKHYSAFVEGFAARAQKFKLGDGLNPETQMGPMITAKARDTAEAVIEDAVSAGARLVCGGRRPAEFNAGYFLQPTVLGDVTDDMRVFAQENFSPVAAVARFEDDDDVISRANADDMGLAAFCFTTSAKRARRAVAELQAGMVGVNSFALASAETPFGGVGFSGLGREGGQEGVQDYLETKLAQIVL